MPETSEELLRVLLRSTAFLAVTCLLVWMLLRLLKVRSVRIQALAWSAVLLQGIMLLPLHVEVPVSATAEIHDVTFGQTAIDSMAFDIVGDVEFPASVQDTVTLLEADPSIDTTSLLVFGWILGATVTVLWLLAAYARFIGSLPTASTSDSNVDVEWQIQWDSLRELADFRTAVRLTVTDDVGPAVCWTPAGYRLLIPDEKWKALSESQRDLVLRHELAHLQRRDLWTTLFFNLVACLHWFNPFAWLAVRRIAECAEWSCDEVVRRSTAIQTTEYVRALLEFSVSKRRVPNLVPTAAGHSLVRRTQRLLTPKLTEDSGMKKITAMLIVATLAVAGGLNFELVAQEETAVVSEAAVSGSEDDQEGAIDLVHVGVDDANSIPGSHTPGFLTLASTYGTTLSGVAEKVPTGGTPISQVIGVVIEDIDSDSILQANRVELLAGTDRDRLGTKEAVIDVAYVFEHLPEFTKVKEALQKNLKMKDAQMKAESMAIRRLSERLASSNAAEQPELQIALLEQKAELEAAVRKSRQQLTEQEAQMYASVFGKVRLAIADHARENGIHIVRRASIGRGQQDRLNSGDPKAVIQAMNEQVLYIADDSIDITDAVLERLKKGRDSSADESDE